MADDVVPDSTALSFHRVEIAGEDRGGPKSLFEDDSCKCSRLYAWRGLHLLFHLAKQGAALNPLITGRGNVSADQQYVLLIVTGGKTLQVDQRAHKETRPDQQQERERDLRDDQRLAEPALRRALRHALSAFERGVRFDPSRAQCRSCSEDQSREQRSRKCKPQDADVGR